MFLAAVASLIASDVKARREFQQHRELLEEENRRLRGELGGILRPENIIGNSWAMRLVYQRIGQVAGSTTTVLIRGESGRGKELVAAAVHYPSPRAQQPFVRVNYAASNEQLLESELFGHEKGDFTGALQGRIGRVEHAWSGTLFLDEIGDFTPAIQVKLLRVLQEREYERVGSNEVRKADVRIIAADGRIAVLGIAGPGDPFAEPAGTLETPRRVRQEFPDLLLCVASNGLNVAPHAAEPASIGISHITLTVNAVDPEIAGRLYAWVRHDRRV